MLMRHRAAPADAAEDYYEEAKKRAAPYDKIVGELPEMGEHRQSGERGRPE